MNGQLMELWGHWLANTMRGQNQVDMMRGWWLRGLQDWSSSAFGGPNAMLWGIPFTQQPQSSAFEGWHQLWDALFKMQQLCLQWAQVVPRHKYDQLAEHAQELEEKITEQAKTIDRLRKMLRETGSENNVVVSQLQELIGQQSQQFKQMTQSVSDYIKSSAEKVTKKK